MTINSNTIEDFVNEFNGNVEEMLLAFRLMTEKQLYIVEDVIETYLQELDERYLYAPELPRAFDAHWTQLTESPEQEVISDQISATREVQDCLQLVLEEASDDEPSLDWIDVCLPVEEETDTYEPTLKELVDFNK